MTGGEIAPYSVEEALRDLREYPVLALDRRHAIFKAVKELVAENERLRTALKPFAEDFDEDDDGVPHIYLAARRALERKPE